MTARPNMSDGSCKKRDDYLEWPEYFMAVAFLSAQRSKDPSSQVNRFCRWMFRYLQRYTQRTGQETMPSHLKNAVVICCPLWGVPSGLCATAPAARQGTPAICPHYQTLGQCFFLGWSLHCEYGKQDRWDWVQWDAKWVQRWPVALEENSRK